MNVAFIPVWKSNPYHQELENALRAIDVHVYNPNSLKTLYQEYVSGKSKVDVLHLHALPYFSLMPSRFVRYVLFYCRLALLKWQGMVLVWTVHDFQNHDSSAWRIENLINGRISRWLDGLIVHGKTADAIVKSEWDLSERRHIYVVPHGHYINSYRNDLDPKVARATFGFDQSNLVFLFLGLIRPYKGVPEMIEAFKACGDSNARLIIVGKPANEAVLHSVQEVIAGDPRILFVPSHVPDDDIQIYMNACDVVVLPYRRIFTSGVAILAMSFGKPCIAPRAGCVVDALDEEGAFFFEPAVSGDLGRVFREAVLRRDRLSEMGSHNLQRASTLEWSGIAQTTADVYQACLDKKRSLFRT